MTTEKASPHKKASSHRGDLAGQSVRFSSKIPIYGGINAESFPLTNTFQVISDSRFSGQQSFPWRTAILDNGEGTRTEAAVELLIIAR